MKRIEIKAYKRDAIGKNPVKKIRNDNKVPCVMYGGDLFSLYISNFDALKLYQARHDNFIIKLI